MARVGLLPKGVPLSHHSSRTFSPTRRTPQAGCRLLRVVTLFHEDATAAAVAAGALPLARRLMAQRATLPLRFAACNLAAAVARTAERARAALEAGVVVEIAHLVTESVTHPDRMEIAAGALEAVSCVDEVRAAAAQLSCVGALLAAQRANSTDVPVQTVTCKALVRGGKKYLHFLFASACAAD